jgi:hypothetical protein
VRLITLGWGDRSGWSERSVVARTTRCDRVRRNTARPPTCCHRSTDKVVAVRRHLFICEAGDRPGREKPRTA